MTADQVLRFAIVKICEELSYRKPAERVEPNKDTMENYRFGGRGGMCPNVFSCCSCVPS